MRYNFTDEVRRVLGKARESARGLGHDYVGTEHLLMGILEDQDNVAATILVRLVERPAELAERLEAEVKPGKAFGTRGELPHTARAKRVLELAMRESRDLGDGFVGSEHLLLGLILEKRGIAAQVLVAVGVIAGRVRQCLPDVRGTGPAYDADVWFLEVDPDSGTPIYEQIIARIEEAVATGKLEVGERLAPVRQMAEELGVAPGTVARAYSDLEKRGILETEGARGTRVASRAASAASKDDRLTTLEGLLRPVVVAAYHLGASAEQLRKAMERAMKGIFGLL